MHGLNTWAAGKKKKKQKKKQTRTSRRGDEAMEDVKRARRTNCEEKAGRGEETEGEREAVGAGILMGSY